MVESTVDQKDIAKAAKRAVAMVDQLAWQSVALMAVAWAAEKALMTVERSVLPTVASWASRTVGTWDGWLAAEKDERMAVTTDYRTVDEMAACLVGQRVLPMVALWEAQTVAWRVDRLVAKMAAAKDLSSVGQTDDRLAAPMVLTLAVD